MPDSPVAWLGLALLASLALSPVWHLLLCRPRRRVAVSLGLTFGDTMKLTQSAVATIAPKDADKLAADVTNIRWSADADGLVPAADGMSAVLTPVASGVVTVTVVATNSDGVDLTETASVTVVRGVATTLGLTIAEPTPAPV